MSGRMQPNSSRHGTRPDLNIYIAVSLPAKVLKVSLGPFVRVSTGEEITLTLTENRGRRSRQRMSRRRCPLSGRISWGAYHLKCIHSSA